MIHSFRNLFTVIIFISGFALFGQQTENILVSPSGDTIAVSPIEIINISQKIVEFSTKQKTYSEKLITTKTVYEIDTSSRNIKDFLTEGKSKLTENIEQLSLIKLDNTKREWKGHYQTLEDWETKVTDRIVDLDVTLFNIQTEKEIWILTHQSAIAEKTPKESVNRINEVIRAIREIEKTYKSKKDSIIVIQSNLSEFQILVEEVLDILEKRRGKLQYEYFIQNQSPLWNAGDSTLEMKNARTQFIESFEDHTNSIKIYAENNGSKIFIHIFVFLCLLLLFFYLKKDFGNHELPDTKQIDRIKIFLNHYFLSSLLIALVYAILIYTNFPTAIREFVALLLLIPTLILYVGIIPRKLRILFYLVVILYLLDLFHIFFPAKTLLTRLLLLIQDIFLVWILFSIIRKNSPIREVYSGKWLRFILRSANVLIFITILSIIGNLLGYTNLAILLSSTIIGLVIAAIILNLLVSMHEALFYSLFKTKLFQKSYIIKTYEEPIIRKLFSFLIYLAIFIWIRAIFVSLGLADQAGNWIYGLMDQEWKFGSVNISFGGIISFFLAILITAIVVRGIRYLLEDEIFPRIKLSRGVPGAISMVVRYTLVAFGIYVALSAAGIDLGKFGLIAGALGVGIGFGLQGVVYNFIAGLILAFERPIQKGDTIELGTLFGDVISIGVRASTVRTYDGSEVIVPNGNLISNELINWTLSDRRRRREVKINVAYGSNPREVMELLFKVASENENVLPNPKPWPLFDGFGDSCLNFRVLFWVDFDRGLTIQSKVAMKIYDALANAGIHIPFPQTDLHIKSFDPTIQKTVFPFSKEQAKKTPERKQGRPKKQDDIE